MKKILIIISFVLIGYIGYGQFNKDDKFMASLYFEPQHFGMLSKNPNAFIHFKNPDGFNMGARMEYIGANIYGHGEIYSFPELNDLNYFSIGGGIGYNWRNKLDKWRIYAGGVGGMIKRSGWGHCYLGIETGIEYTFENGLTIGTRYSGRERTDNKEWGVDESFWSDQAGLIIGYKW